jgi:hypothetical protein
MKYTMQTESGAVYAIDEDARTWRRVGKVPIYGLDRSEGEIDAPIEPRIGQRTRIWDRKIGAITTTRVVRLEVTG